MDYLLKYTNKRIKDRIIKADTDLLKIVPVKILVNFGNNLRTLQLGL